MTPSRWPHRQVIAQPSENTYLTIRLRKCRDAREIQNVTRAAPILVALVLVFVLFGGPCLACATATTQSMGHDCCRHKKDCQESRYGSSSGCVSIAVDLANAELAPALILVGPIKLSPADAFEIALRQPAMNTILRESILHSPPELCLLNSVLTI
jgi:hypothetical protein